MPRSTVWFFDLLRILVRKEMRLRYRGAAAGVLWSLANPIAFAVVLHLAFQRVLRLQIEDYALFILSGLFAWQWILNSVTSGTTAYVQNRAIVRKLPFPRITLSLAAVLGDGFQFLCTLPILLGLAWAKRGAPDPVVWLVGVPLLLAVQVATLTALVALLSCANAFFRDLEHAVGVGLLLGFYVTPVLFPVDLVPADLSWILYANPLAPLILSWRALVLDDALSPFIPWAVFHAALLAVLVAPLYRRLEWRVAEVV